MEFSQKLKQLRIKRSMTQSELGIAVGVSEKVISKWENGDTQPSIDKLPFIADAFDVDIDSLFDHTHDLTSDILKSVAAYMETIPPQDAIRTAQRIASYVILGASIRVNRDGGWYSKGILDELKLEWQQLINDNDTRPQRYFFEEKQNKLHDYKNGSMDNYLCEDIMLTVFQAYPDGLFENILDKYNSFRKVFSFLVLPDAEKLLKYRYSNNMPDNFTVEYLSQESGASKNTVEAYLNLNDCAEMAQYVTLDGVKQLMYTKPSGYGAQSMLQTVISAAYVFAVKRNGGQR